MTAAATERVIFMLREHLLEEERVLYPAIEGTLGSELLMELGDRAAQQKTVVAVSQEERTT